MDEIYAEMRTLAQYSWGEAKDVFGVLYINPRWNELNEEYARLKARLESAQKPRQRGRNKRWVKEVLALWRRDPARSAGSICNQLQLKLKTPPSLSTAKRIIGDEKKRLT